MVDPKNDGEAVPVKRKRGTMVEWTQRIEEQRASGLSVRRFCQERGLFESAFYRWRKKVFPEVSNTSAKRPAGVPFAEVAFPMSGPRIDLKRGDLSIALPTSIAPEMLQAAMTALGALPC